MASKLHHRTFATGPSYTFLTQNTYTNAATIITPENITLDQLNVCAVGWYELGQKLQKNAQKA